MSASQPFAAALITNAVLFAVFLLVFLALRKRVREVYEPRTIRDGVGIQPPSAKLLGWVDDALFTYSEEAIYCTSGADAVMYLRFLRAAALAVAIQLIYGAVVLMPIHVTGENPGKVSGLQLLSIDTIGPGSARLIAHVIGVVINTAVTLVLLRREYGIYVEYKLRSVTECRAQNYTVLIADGPTDRDARAAVSGALKAALARVAEDGPGAGRGPFPVAGLEGPVDFPDLTKRFADRQELAHDAEVAAIEEARAGPRGPLFGRPGRDAASLQKRVKEADADLSTMREFATNALARGERVKGVVACPAYLARLTALYPAVALVRRGLLPLPGATAYRAPDPRAVIWENLPIGRASRAARSVAVGVFLFLMIVFWTVPMTAVQSIANLESVFGLFGAADKVGVIPGPLAAWLQGYLPVLFVMVLNMLVPIIVRWCANKAGLPSHTLADSYVLTRIFAFKVVNVILAGALVGAIIRKLPDMTADALAAGKFRALAQGVSDQSDFFVNYLMIAALSGVPMDLARIGPLVTRWFKRRFTCVTEKDFEAADAAGPLPYPLAYANHALAFTIALVYSTTAPFIAAWALLYFVLASAAASYGVLFIHEPLYQSSALHWRKGFGLLFWSLLLYHALMLFEFAALSSPAAAGCALFVLVASAAVWILFERLGERRFQERVEAAAAQADVIHGTNRELALRESEGWYRQPEMLPPGTKRPLVLPPGTHATTAVASTMDLLAIQRVAGSMSSRVAVV